MQPLAHLIQLAESVATEPQVMLLVDGVLLEGWITPRKRYSLWMAEIYARAGLGETESTTIGGVGPIPPKLAEDVRADWTRLLEERRSAQGAGGQVTSVAWEWFAMRDVTVRAAAVLSSNFPRFEYMAIRTTAVAAVFPAAHK